jgi:hypothetical protein
MAIWSLAQTTASGREPRSSSTRAAAAPLPAEKSPWITWSMTLPRTASSNARCRSRASGASFGPVTKQSVRYR